MILDCAAVFEDLGQHTLVFHTYLRPNTSVLTRFAYWMGSYDNKWHFPSLTFAIYHVLSTKSNSTFHVGASQPS